MNNIYVALLLLFVLMSCSEKKQETERQELTLEELISTATFTDLEGNVVSLSDYTGDIILIDFWETWCGPCLEVFPAMDRLRNEYPDDFTVIAVNAAWSDAEEDVTSFASENDYDFIYAIDSQELLTRLGVPGIPYKIVLAPDGSIIKAELGTYGTEGDYQYTKELIEKYFN